MKKIFLICDVMKNGEQKIIRILNVTTQEKDLICQSILSPMRDGSSLDVFEITGELKQTRITKGK